MKEKIVIFNFSQIGYQIAKVLKDKDYDILIIDEDETKLETARSLGYKTSNLSLMKDENFTEVGLVDDNNIKAFFCVSDDKNTNLFVTLSLRNLNKDIMIISVSFNKEDNKTMILAGANKIVNPYEIGALRIFRLLHKPLILDLLDNLLFTKTDIDVSEITIEEGSIFDGVYLNELNIIDQHDIIILGIQDKELGDKFVFYSTGINHKIDAGDTLVILGKSKNLQKFKEILKHTL